MHAMLWVVPRIGPVLTSILFFLGVKELSMQFLWGYSGFFPQVSHLNLFALNCCSYSNVAIHSELLYKNYFSYSVSVPDKMTSPGRQSGELHGGQRPHDQFYKFLLENNGLARALCPYRIIIKQWTG